MVFFLGVVRLLSLDNVCSPCIICFWRHTYVIACIMFFVKIQSDQLTSINLFLFSVSWSIRRRFSRALFPSFINTTLTWALTERTRWVCSRFRTPLRWRISLKRPWTDLTWILTDLSTTPRFSTRHAPKTQRTCARPNTLCSILRWQYRCDAHINMSNIKLVGWGLCWRDSCLFCCCFRPLTPFPFWPLRLCVILKFCPSTANWKSELNARKNTQPGVYQSNICHSRVVLCVCFQSIS